MEQELLGVVGLKDKAMLGQRLIRGHCFSMALKKKSGGSVCEAY